MKSELINIEDLNPNENNPRLIKDGKFKKLVTSVKELPDMLNIRPLIVDEDLMILGGNMRYRACIEAGIKEVPTIIVTQEATKETCKRRGITYEALCDEITIKDNVGFGEWDYDQLANEWGDLPLQEWGLDVWKGQEFDNEDFEEKLNNDINEKLEGGDKTIKIEFQPEHYKEATELVKFFKERKLYIGGFLIEQLKKEKAKLK